MIDTSTSHLKTLIDELLKHGEDKFELNLWSNIFSQLAQDEKEELISNFEKELERLNQVKQVK